VAKVFSIELPFAVLAMLTLSVWLIYLFDHILDSRVKREQTFHSPRHWFYHRNVGLMHFLAVIVFLSLVFFMFKIPTELIWGGFMLGSFVVAYFVFVQYFFKKRFLLKEILAAGIYSVGIYLPTFILSEKVDASFYLIEGAFLLIALFNLVLFALLELPYDEKAGFTSLATELNGSTLKQILIVVIGLAFLVLIFCPFTSSNLYFYLLTFSYFLVLFIHILIFIKQEYFLIRQRYRWVGDLSLFIPGALLFI
jgi:4-hydroxybenzoate polyprenyltransferase